MSRKTRKLIWSAPLVAVLAVAGALAMFVTLSPNGAQAHEATLPGAPMNVEAEAVNAESIKLTWEAPADDGGAAITGYRIDYLDGGSGITWQELVDNTGDTSMEHTDGHELMANEDRAYRVFAINAVGTGPTSAVAFGNTNSTPAITTPDAVTNLSVRQASGNDAPTQLNLSWSAPAKDGGSPITSYRIYMARTNAADGLQSLTAASEVTATPNFTAASPNPIVIDTESTMTSHSLTGLRAQQTWHISVRAVNKSGTDGADAVSTATALVRSGTTGQAINPASPTGLRVVATANDATALYWYWPEHDGGSNIASFRVEVQRSGGGWPGMSDTATTKPVADIGTNGHAVIEATLNTDASTDATHSSIPGDLNGDGTPDVNPTQRTLTYRVITVTDAGKRSAASTAYTVTLDASDALTIPGTSTAEATFTGPPALSAVPGRLYLNWDAATKDDGTGTNTQVDADSPGYRIDYSEGSSGNLQWKRLEPNTIFTDLPYKHDAKADQAYRYRVFAQPLSRGVAPAVFGGTTSPASAATAPGAPTDLRGTVVNPGQIDLEWTAPEEDGGSEITGYRIRVAAAGTALPNAAPTVDATETLAFTAADATAIIDVKADMTSYSLMGLPSLTTWQIDVYAQNASGTTPPTVNSATPAGPITLTTTEFDTPAPPIGLLAEEARNSNLAGRTKRGVLLLWNAPEPPIGAMLTKYEIQWKEDKEGEEYADLTIPTNTDLRTHQTHGPPDPREDEVRMYRVRSVANSTFADAPAGNALMSEWVEVRYPDAGLHNHPPMDGADLTAMVTAGQTTMVQSTISDSDMGDMLTWSVAVDPSDGSIATATVDDMGMVTIMGHMAGMATITVTAMDSDDETAMQSIMVTVASGALMTPTLTATPGTGSVTLMWDQSNAVEFTVWGVRPDGSAVRADSMEALIRVDDITDTSYEVTGLMSGEEYWFAVTACQMANCGAGEFLHSLPVIVTPD